MNILDNLVIAPNLRGQSIIVWRRGNSRSPVRTTYVILYNIFTKVIFIIFAEVARGLGGRDEENLSKYHLPSVVK